MFGFGWVRIHLGVVLVMLLEYLRLFGWVFRKMDKKIKNQGNIGGPTPRRRDPLSQQRSTPRRVMSTPRRG